MTQDNMMNEAGGPVDLLDQTEALYRDVAEELAQALQGVRRGEISEAKAAVQAVKDLRTAFHLVMEERTRVEKLRRQLAGVAAWLASATPESVEAFLDGLDDNALLALPWIFEFWALDHQLPPEGDWKSWVIMGGRGAGKTRAGAEWVRAQVEGARPLDPGRARRVALVGETFDQVRDVMVMGESGILACSPPDRRPVWEATRRRLVWPNGATAQAFSAHEPEALRGPQFDAAWVDEMGCAAIDKGTNEPNKFLDPKSSESALPHYSDGRRDDYMQMQYLRAMTSYWGDDARNPVSEFYGGPMVDMSHAHVWAWDVRPYPQFPGLPDLWEDAANYARGHWISGRATAQPLAQVVGEICALAGVSVFDVSALHGVVRGYAMPGGITPRGALQSLSLIYGFDALERDGVLVFRMRDASVDAELLPPLLALDGEDQSLETRRVPEAEIAGRVRLAYVEADGSFETRAVEAIFPDEVDGPASASEAPLALTRAEGMRVVHRWLAEARVARDTVQFTLPPSMGWLGPGDVVVLQTEEGALRYRIDRMERAEAIRVEAVRVESGIYDPSEETDEVARIESFTPPVPVTPVFLDLPLLTGAEDPYAPHLAVTASPWPGAAALYSALEDAGYALNTKVETQAAVGVTQAILPRAQSGLWDRGPGLRVKMLSGELHSASEASVLAGLNAMAIGDGSSDRWEIFQFVTAEPVDPGVWDISTRLRGQAGSDAVMPDVWPEGSVVVMLDGAPRQIEVAPSARNLARHYRVGPAGRGYDDPSYIHTVQAFAGIGLRPLSPCHLHAGAQGGDLRLSWVRRTRIGGDDWEALDVPLGEASERYRVRVLEGQTIRREVIVSTPEWTYGAAERAEDGMIAAPTFEVAQISDVFGPGLPARLIWTG
ncbi:glycoside hydrolase TIM-barrel-like domain-containing protein [Thioclava sp. IC9]|uniref:baseplate megatron protein TIM-barrel domain-containing protein n=1 Tax=Thioclava sp. IC9 TaxID=1973007 RepID=UPI001411DB94|nr:glycoside hydrolase TIM-barrel-like domain-containing protein [Thioclava sp. IC9]